MAYGLNAPQGFVPRTYKNGVTWNGALMNVGDGHMGIESGYDVSLFTGDPVQFNYPGIIGLCDFGATAPVGIFQGCFYYDRSRTPIFSPFWSAGTSTYNDVPAEAWICTDQNVLYSIQSSSYYIGGVAGPVLTGISPEAVTLQANVTIGQSAYPINPLYNYTYSPDTVAANPTAGYPAFGRSGYYLEAMSINCPTVLAAATAGVPAPTGRHVTVAGFDRRTGIAGAQFIEPGTTASFDLPRGSFNNSLVSLNFTPFQGDPSVIHSATITLTAAQVQGLAADMMVLLPGIANKTMALIDGEIQYNYDGTTAFGGGGDIVLCYESGPTPAITGTILNAADLAGTVDLLGYATPLGILTGSNYGAVAYQQAIGIRQDGGVAFTGGGNSTLVVTLRYKVLDALP